MIKAGGGLASGLWALALALAGPRVVGAEEEIVLSGWQREMVSLQAVGPSSGTREGKAPSPGWRGGLSRLSGRKVAAGESRPSRRRSTPPAFRGIREGEGGDASTPTRTRYRPEKRAARASPTRSIAARRVLANAPAAASTAQAKGDARRPSGGPRHDTRAPLPPQNDTGQRQSTYRAWVSDELVPKGTGRLPTASEPLEGFTLCCGPWALARRRTCVAFQESTASGFPPSLSATPHKPVEAEGMASGMASLWTYRAYITRVLHTQRGRSETHMTRGLACLWIINCFFFAHAAPMLPIRLGTLLVLLPLAPRGAKERGPSIDRWNMGDGAAARQRRAVE